MALKANNVDTVERRACTKSLENSSDSFWEPPTAWNGKHKAGEHELSRVQVTNGLGQRTAENTKQETRVSSAGNIA